MHQYLYAKASPPNYIDRWGYHVVSTDPTDWSWSGYLGQDCGASYYEQEMKLVRQSADGSGHWHHYKTRVVHVVYNPTTNDWDRMPQSPDPGTIDAFYPFPIDGGSNGDGDDDDGGSSGGSGGSGGGGGTSPSPPTPEEIAAEKWDEAIAVAGAAPLSYKTDILSRHGSSGIGDPYTGHRQYPQEDPDVVGGASQHLVIDPEDDVLERKPLELEPGGYSVPGSLRASGFTLSLGGSFAPLKSLRSGGFFQLTKAFISHRGAKNFQTTGVVRPSVGGSMNLTFGLLWNVNEHDDYEGGSIGLNFTRAYVHIGADFLGFAQSGKPKLHAYFRVNFPPTEMTAGVAVGVTKEYDGGEPFYPRHSILLP